MFCFKKNDEFGFSLKKKDDWDCSTEITNTEYSLLFEGQSKGKVIKFKEDATPYLVDLELPKSKKELYDEGKLSKKEYNLYIDELREADYRREADPLGMQVMRGDVEKNIWLEKIEEIKKRYPKVE